jgi:hypothetical protein
MQDTTQTSYTPIFFDYSVHPSLAPHPAKSADRVRMQAHLRELGETKFDSLFANPRTVNDYFVRGAEMRQRFHITPQMMAHSDDLLGKFHTYHLGHDFAGVIAGSVATLKKYCLNEVTPTRRKRYIKELPQHLSELIGYRYMTGVDALGKCLHTAGAPETTVDNYAAQRKQFVSEAGKQLDCAHHVNMRDASSPAAVFDGIDLCISEVQSLIEWANTCDMFPLAHTMQRELGVAESELLQVRKLW